MGSVICSLSTFASTLPMDCSRQEGGTIVQCLLGSITAEFHSSEESVTALDRRLGVGSNTARKLRKGDGEDDPHELVKVLQRASSVAEWAEVSEPPNVKG